MAYIKASEEPLHYAPKEHFSHLCKTIRTFQLNGLFTDVTLVCKTKRIQCHRLLLAGSCTYFERMFSSDMKETKTQEVDLSFLEVETFSKIIEFIYSGEIDIDQRNVQALYQMSDLLGLSTLLLACINYMLDQIEPDNCLGFYMFARLYNIKPLMKTAERFMCLHFSSIANDTENEDLCLFPEEELVRLISSDIIRPTSECDVYKLLTKWTRADLENRKCRFERLLKCVRLSLCPKRFLADIAQTDDLMHIPSCQNLVQSVIESKQQAAKRHQDLDNTTLALFVDNMCTYWTMEGEKFVRRFANGNEMLSPCGMNDAMVLAPSSKGTFIIIDTTEIRTNVKEIESPQPTSSQQLVKSETDIFLMTQNTLWKLDRKMFEWREQCCFQLDESIQVDHLHMAFIGEVLYVLIDNPLRSHFKSNEYTANVWMLDIDDGSWHQRLDDSFKPFDMHSDVVCTATKMHIYAYDPYHPWMLFEYDTLRSKWECRFPPHKPAHVTFRSFSITNWNDQILLSGGKIEGQEGQKTSDVIVQYNPLGDKWSVWRTRLPSPSTDHTLIAINIPGESLEAYAVNDFRHII